MSDLIGALSCTRGVKQAVKRCSRVLSRRESRENQGTGLSLIRGGKATKLAAPVFSSLLMKATQGEEWSRPIITLIDPTPRI
ncbi:hypothetical protein BaRGS_00019383 [Batillaria attramentaria]|uniref:Uncharacterized protein n=1 Tax=Batillaria attramentaria TaxID=370345 RepID=A0ABD0KQK5_9CAEN